MSERAVVTPLYRAMVLELERRRLQLGWTMMGLNDASGVPDGYWAKALYADTPSGRQARWDTLQDIVQALYPMGYDIEIRAKHAACLSAQDQRAAIANAGAMFDRQAQRDRMRELARLSWQGKQRKKRPKAKLKKWGKLGGIARSRSLSPQRRIEIARKAAAARGRITANAATARAR